MNKMQSCLSREILDQIGRDEVLPNELQCIEEHVSECEYCRDLFAAETADPEWSNNILPILRERRSALTGNVEAGQSPGHESILSLLGPTDDPRMLGRIGPYEVTGVIGRGGMGVVFKAFDKSLDRFVAIKMLLPHLATSGAARKRFFREGQAAAAVIDDHVLPIYGVNEWQGVPYLVTQYSSGMSLQKRIQEQAPLELKEILRISLQTARGLAAAHAQGLVHRDVKPSNILLDGTVARALLTDFGLARAVDDASITRTGTITGTPQFMAPEQARGESVNQRSDLFCLGAVIYAMCTGHPPFRAETSYGVLRRITDEEPRAIHEINPDIPDWFVGIVTRLMAKQSGDRFESASEVASLLEECLAHVQQPTSVSLPESLQPHRKAETARFPIRRRVWPAVVMVLCGLLLAGAIAKMAGDADQGVGGTHEPPAAAEEPDASNNTTGIPRADGTRIGTVLGKPIFEGDLNKNVDLREDLVRLFVRPVEEKYLKEKHLDPEEELKKRIRDDGARVGALMFVRQRVLHEHLYKERGGRVLLAALGPIAYDAHRQWLEEREQAGDFHLDDAEHHNLLFAPLAESLQSRLTEDRDTIQQAFDPAVTEDFIKRMSVIPAEVRDPSTAVEQRKSESASISGIDKQLAHLPESEHLNFAKDGLPANCFALRGEDVSKYVVTKPDGLHVTHPGTDGYSSSSVETQIRVHGDFDVVASFENFTFEPGDDGSGGISLMVILENDGHTHGTVHRGAMVDPLNPICHFVQSEFLASPQRDPGVVWLGTTVEEAKSGRLRLARVDGTLYCLFAAADSPECLIHTEVVGPDSLLFGGVRLITGVQSNGSTHGTSSVIWKDLTIRAERITDWPVAESP